jgi:enamine deaminase RidA (YjgF/YER057c/UK114 family)
MLAPPHCRLLFIAGQIGWDRHRRLVAGGFVPQFEQALSNVLEVVYAAGGSATDLLRLGIYVVDRGEYLGALKPVGAAYRRVLGQHYPAMTLVEVAGLIEPGARVEIEGIAAIPLGSLGEGNETG